MTRKALLLGLLMTMILFVTTGWAGNGHKKPRPANSITDASGRTHVRPMGRISDAQRKAAAKRRKALRDKATRRNVPRPGKGEVNQ